MKRYGNETFKDDFGIALHTNDRVPIHWHSFYEIELCVSGEGIQYINGVAGKIEKGTATFLSPKDFHRIEVTDSPIRLLNFFFYGYLMTSYMLNLISESKPPFCVTLEGEEYEKMLSRIYELQDEEKKSDAFHARSVRCRIEAIAIDIMRMAMKRRDDNSETSLSVKESKTFSMIVKDAVPYINEHFADCPSRDEMAERLHLNPSYFSDLFKSRLGISYSEYITNVRMSEAMRLLKYTDKTVNEIMAEVGYHSPTAFYRKFKECYGMLPGEVRRNGYEYE